MGGVRRGVNGLEPTASFRIEPQLRVRNAQMRQDGPVVEVPSASPIFVALDPSKRFLHVINEIDDYEGESRERAKAGTLEPLNQQPLNSPIPVHLAVDPLPQPQSNVPAARLEVRYGDRGRTDSKGLSGRK
jgi:hypothetical protein